MAWYDNDWSFRVKITVDNTQVDADLTDFPVYVDLSDLPAGFFTNVQSDGDDIRVTTSDGETECPIEVVSIDTGAETGELHFEAPSLSSSTDTDFYIYYGNAVASAYAVGATFGRNAVWANGYAGVWHLEEDPSGTAPQMVDSTGNGNDGTSSGSMTSGDSVTAKVGKGLDFDGGDDYIDLPEILASGATSVTVGLWSKINNTSAEYRGFSHDETEPYISYRFNQGGTADRFEVNLKTSTADHAFADTSMTLTNFNHLVISATENGNGNLYANGSLADGPTALGDFQTAGPHNNVLGANRLFGANLPGILDEVRISSVARSANWISTEYNNQSAPATFYTVGAQEELGTTVDVSVDTVSIFGPTVTVSVSGVNLFETAYEIRVFNAAGTLQHVLTELPRGFSYAKRVNAPGMLRFELHSTHDLVSNVARDWQCAVRRRRRADAGKSNAIDWYTDFSGLIRDAPRRADSDGQTYMTFVARGDLDLLARSIVAYPADTSNRTQFGSTASETIAKTLVQYNATSSGTTADGRDRDVPTWGSYISIQTDAGGGTVRDSWFTRTNLLRSIQDVARGGGGDFDLVKTAARAWEYRWYAGQLGTDRTSTVTFALNFGNMANPVLATNWMDEATVAIVGGKGEGSDRDIEVRTGTNYDASTNSREILVDARDIDSGQAKALQDRGDLRLDEVEAKRELTFDVIQTPGSLYGLHYFLGDKVNSRYLTVQQNKKIVGVTVDVDEGGREDISLELENV